jgi:hypothetical protein
VGDFPSTDLLKTYIGVAARTLTEPKSDLSQFSIIWIVPSNGSRIAASHTFTALPGSGVPMNTGELRRVVALGSTIYSSTPDAGANILVHETGHIFGLPDLYNYYSSGSSRTEGWDVMNAGPLGAHFTSWHQAKLGWISSSQMRCVDAGTATVTLTPVEVPGGIKGAVVPVSSSRAYVIESRELAGQDTGICTEGVLIYEVDSLKAGGREPMRLAGGSGVTNTASRRCGPGFDAPFGLSPGQASRFKDPAEGVSVEVLHASLGQYQVRVTKTGPWDDLVADAWSVSQEVSVQRALPLTRDLTVISTRPSHNVRAAVVSETPWLRVSPAVAVSPSTLSVTVDPRGLSEGLYTGNIRLFDDDTPGAGQIIPVRLTVSP